MIKILLPIFSHNIECDKPQGTFCKGSQAILTITVELIRAFFLGPESLLKTQFFFLKKAKFPVKKTLWPIFSGSMECDKPAGKFVRVQKVFGSSLWNL